MNTMRKTALVAGSFFLATEVTAIAGLLLYGTVLTTPDFVVSTSVDDTPVLAGAFMEILLVVANVGTAVTLYPVIRRYGAGLALGHVAWRLIEAVLILIGALSLLTVVSLRHDLAGAAGTDATAAVTVGRALVDLHDWTFLLGPKLALGINTTLLAWLMFRSRLVPRVIAILGLVGGPLVFASGTAVFFGAYADMSVAGFAAAVPVLAWEVSVALWMVIKGFRIDAVPAGPESTRTSEMAAAVA